MLVFKPTASFEKINSSNDVYNSSRKAPAAIERLDPKTSFWSHFYLEDKAGTYGDPKHRHG